MSEETIDLAVAAEQLGVHYQTAYKWVRSGALPSSLVRGRYRLSPEDVAELARRRDRPARPRVRQPRQGYDALRERMFDALVTGNERAARSLTSSLLQDGVSVTTVTEELLVPALTRIGDEWSAGRLPVSIEHRASATAERLLGEHHPTPRGRRRGTVAVAGVEGDRHALPTLMAAIALREDNWNVHHLGADVPGDELVSFCESEAVDLVVVTVTSASGRRRARRAAARLEALDLPVLVGRPGATLEELLATARDAHRGRLGAGQSSV